MVQVERVFSGFYAPGRWPTDDGCMPVQLCWVYWQALQMGQASDALATAQGIGLALGDGHQAEQARTATLRAALPLERTE
jgi:hypothetical protein